MRLAGRIPETVKAGLLVLRRVAKKGSRGRALLPVLSVLIGVWLGAMSFGVGDAVYQRTMNSINKYGLDTISLMAFPSGMDDSNFDGLTLRDARNIERLPNVRAVSPQKRLTSLAARRGDITAEVHVRAIVDLGTRKGRGLSGYRIDMGEFITRQDDRDREQVAVLGSVAREKLFPPGINPIGEQILIRNVLFRVKGVLKRRTHISTGSDDEIGRRIEESANSWINVPYRTASCLLFDDDKLNSIHVFVDDVEKVADTARAIEDLGIRLHGHDIYNAEFPGMFLTQARAFRKRLLVAMGSIGGVALLAGNLIVIAIMLLSVRARRREIGLRMAVGARRSDIFRLFFGEALIFSVLGGLAGVLVACASIPALRFFDVPAGFAMWQLALPFACAIAAAIPFALIPARRASRMNPVAALSES